MEFGEIGSTATWGATEAARANVVRLMMAKPVSQGFPMIECEVRVRTRFDHEQVVLLAGFKSVTTTVRCLVNLRVGGSLRSGRAAPHAVVVPAVYRTLDVGRLQLHT